MNLISEQLIQYEKYKYIGPINVLSKEEAYEIKKEIEKYENMVLSIRSCTTPFNVYYIDELYDFFVHQQPVNIGAPTLVQDVPHADVSYLPTNVKEKVLEKLLKYDILETLLYFSLCNNFGFLEI